MFDINNNMKIAELIDKRPKTHVIEPLYIKTTEGMFGFGELKDIYQFNSRSFKVGFGSSIGLFVKSPINNQRLPELDVVKTFKLYKEELQCDRLYYVFESGLMAENDPILKVDPSVYEAMFHYINEINTYMVNQTEGYRKERIKSMLDGYDIDVTS